MLGPFVVSIGKDELGVPKEGGCNGVEHFGHQERGRQKGQIRNHRDAAPRFSVLQALKALVHHFLRFFADLFVEAKKKCRAERLVGEPHEKGVSRRQFRRGERCRSGETIAVGLVIGIALNPVDGRFGHDLERSLQRPQLHRDAFGGEAPRQFGSRDVGGSREEPQNRKNDGRAHG